MSTHLRGLSLFSLALLPLSLFAQDKPADKPQEAPPERKSAPYDRSITDCSKQPTRIQTIDCAYAHAQIRTIQLENVSQPNDANEILVAVRNMADPAVKIYLIGSRNLIAVNTYPEEFARIEALIKSLDLPRKAYRVTFTLAESDSGKRIGVQHFSLIDVAGQRTSLKQGSKVPVATGEYDNSKNGAEEQFTYLDIGMNFDVTLEQSGANLHLKFKVEQSGLAEEKSSFDHDPVVRQSVLEGVANLTIGKPLALGQIDIPGSTRHLDVEIVAEPVQ